jgi:hypothetical protein
LLLSACGVAPEDGATQEPLGTTEAAICSGLSVSSLGITGASSYGGILSATGTWAVSLFANAIRLEYYVDGVPRSYDQRPGNSGTWNHSSSGLSCGAHTFEVRAYPMVIDSNGNQTVCVDSPRSITQTVTQECPTATLSCSISGSSVNCTGGASGGAGPYTQYWQETLYPSDGSPAHVSGWYQGSWSDSFYCAHTTVRDPADRLRIQFKVRDSSGMESTIKTSSFYYCAP